MFIEFRTLAWFRQVVAFRVICWAVPYGHVSLGNLIGYKEISIIDMPVGIWTYSYYLCTSIALIGFWTELTGGWTTPEVPHGS